MALTLTEALIRSRVNLSHENLEDIKSLSLPGTYHERIVSIGTSLGRFTRLKSLDFSRNALESLQGLEHLEMLERLNLYYNRVSSLDELNRLRHNSQLKEIDLRLNPVAKNEPHYYRLYLIHMLPNLKILDEREITDRERQAALMHFSSSQAVEMAPHPTQPPTDTKSPLPRTEMIAKLMKHVPDDETNLTNRQNSDLNRSRPLTGSVARQDRVEDYSLVGLKLQDQDKSHKQKNNFTDDRQTIGTKTADQSLSQTAGDSHMTSYKERYPHLMSVPGDGVHKFADVHKTNPNLFFPDEVEASSKFRGQGYFTPNPKGECELGQQERHRYNDSNTVSNHVSRADRAEMFPTHMPNSKQARPDYKTKAAHDDLLWSRPRQARSSSAPGKEEDRGQIYYADAKEKTFIYSLLNLVDRYWSGKKSLHKHTQFIEQALKYLSEYSLTREHLKEEEINKLRRRVETLEEEITALRKIRGHNLGESFTTAKETELKAALKKAHEDIKRMHAEIRHHISENRILHRKLDAPNFSSNCDSLPHASHKLNMDLVCGKEPNQSVTVDELQCQNEVLEQELDIMRAKVKQYTQLEELASLLQDSHKSLTETNNHLLHELRDTRDKHHQEIEQMHWSYNQLKSTIGYMSSIKPSTPTASQNSTGYSKPLDASRYPTGPDRGLLAGGERPLNVTDNYSKT